MPGKKPNKAFKLVLQVEVDDHFSSFLADSWLVLGFPSILSRGGGSAAPPGWHPCASQQELGGQPRWRASTPGKAGVLWEGNSSTTDLWGTWTCMFLPPVTSPRVPGGPVGRWWPARVTRLNRPRRCMTKPLTLICQERIWIHLTEGFFSSKLKLTEQTETNWINASTWRPGFIFPVIKEFQRNLLPVRRHFSCQEMRKICRNETERTKSCTGILITYGNQKVAASSEAMKMRTRMMMVGCCLDSSSERGPECTADAGPAARLRAARVCRAAHVLVKKKNL